MKRPARTVLGQNVDEQERAKFTSPLSVDDLYRHAKSGSGARILITDKSNPDENVVIAYEKPS